MFEVKETKMLVANKTNIAKFITPSLIDQYNDMIVSQGKVITTANIYNLLNKSGVLGKKLNYVEIAKTDDLLKLEEDVIEITLENIVSPTDEAL